MHVVHAVPTLNKRVVIFRQCASTPPYMTLSFLTYLTYVNDALPLASNSCIFSIEIGGGGKVIVKIVIVWGR